MKLQTMKRQALEQSTIQMVLTALSLRDSPKDRGAGQ
jgi:hypothetical protein